MKYLELHIIQSVPVACLNRDDLNSPKTAVFGGVQRARVSSQSWKRSIREMAKEISPDSFKGCRSRYIINTIINELKTHGKNDTDANNLGLEISAALATKDTEKRVKTLLFSTELELKEFTKTYIDATTPAARKKAIEKMIGKTPKDAADIAIFGRLVASDYTAKLEGAAMFSHALSTHKVDNEIDFFAAVDESPEAKDDPGAAHTSTLEFNSATYYRFAALNLDMMADSEHLASMTLEERQKVVRTFVEATIKAMPSARKNPMNANTLPVYVLGVVREKGHPIQLVNAFENPVRRSERGFAVESVNRMNVEYSDIKETWGIDSVFAKAVVKGSLKEQIKDNLGSIETCSLDKLIDGMVGYVI